MLIYEIMLRLLRAPPPPQKNGGWGAVVKSVRMAEPELGSYIPIGVVRVMVSHVRHLFSIIPM